MARLRTAVIGVGHLGKEHARILAGFEDVELIGVVDVDFEQAQTIANRCNTSAYRHHQLLLDVVDAATIAVPTIHHFQIASDFLRRGIPILVEKPLTDSLPNAESLVSLARHNQALLQVGHIERYNPAFEEIRRRGLRPKFIKCERFGPFSGRSTDIGVVLDLLIHDLDLLLDLVGCSVESTDAVGWTVYGRHEDVCHARLSFSNGCEAHVSASRASTAVRRNMRIWTETGFAKLDFAGKTVSLADPPPGQKLRAAQLKGMSEEAFLPVVAHCSSRIARWRPTDAGITRFRGLCGHRPAAAGDGHAGP